MCNANDECENLNSTVVTRYGSIDAELGLDGNFRERGGFGSKIYSKKVKDSTSATKTVYFIKFQTNTTTLVDIFCNTRNGQ